MKYFFANNKKGGKDMKSLKKLSMVLLSAALLCVLAIAAPKTVSAKTSVTYYETTRVTDIKEGKGSSYDRVIELPKDAVMKVTSTSNSKWYKVEYQNSKQKVYKGYVASKDLKKAVTYKTTAELSIRKEETKSSEEVYEAKKGEKVFVVNTSNEKWYKVVYYHKDKVYRGYMYSSYLKKEKSSDSSSSSSSSSSSKMDVKYVATGDVNMREKANGSSKVLTVVEKGDTVHVTDTSQGKWYKAYYTNSKGIRHTGYISKNYLKKK